MKVSKYVAIVLILLFTAVMSSQAQSTNTGLIAFNQGDLWAWTPGSNAERLTEWRYNGGPILSPDGSKIAYISFATESVESFGTGVGIPSIAQNIWIMETATEDFERIADQSANPGNVFRSIPAWSPDSTRLAWLELTADNFSQPAALRVYDLRTGQTTTMNLNVELGFQDAGVSLGALQWGEGGISRMLFSSTGTGLNLFLQVFDPATGQMLREVSFGTESDQLNVGLRHIWAQYQGRQVIALVNADEQWRVYDVASGTMTPINQRPILTNGSGLQLTWVTRDATQGAPEKWYDWQAIRNGLTQPIGYSSFGLDPHSLPTISPDGTNVAWAEISSNAGTQTVNVWNSVTNNVQTILSGSPQQFGAAPPMSVTWSPLRWVIGDVILQPQPTPTNPPGNASCDLAPRLQIGGNVVVNPGEPNNVRLEPAINAQRVGQLAAGDVALVESGPICANGYNWWRVRSGNLVGWTAEGIAGTYWLSPANGGTPTCWNTPESRLAPDTQVEVLPGEPNVIRTSPDISSPSNIIGQIPAGGRATITGSPACDSLGRRWWPVQYNALQGWTAEGEGNTYWLVPVSN